MRIIRVMGLDYTALLLPVAKRTLTYRPDAVTVAGLIRRLWELDAVDRRAAIRVNGIGVAEGTRVFRTVEVEGSDLVAELRRFRPHVSIWLGSPARPSQEEAEGVLEPSFCTGITLDVYEVPVLAPWPEGRQRSVVPCAGCGFDLTERRPYPDHPHRWTKPHHLVHGGAHLLAESCFSCGREPDPMKVTAQLPRDHWPPLRLPVPICYFSMTLMVNPYRHRPYEGHMAIAPGFLDALQRALGTELRDLPIFTS